MARQDRGVLDTSIIIDFTSILQDALPLEAAITTITVAELSTGPIATKNSAERARRLQRLQWMASAFDAIPFDLAAAQSYARIYDAVVSVSRKPRGGRAIDLMIAATALSRGLPLYTRNPADFRGLTGLLEVIAI